MCRPLTKRIACSCCLQLNKIINIYTQRLSFPKHTRGIVRPSCVGFDCSITFICSEEFVIDIVRS
uniref:Uncharacterized protein n=1 Tax=uncultured marine virus TaxID=186617 RepID=A0A0F7L8B8_9VIRU|nr:hypothetical protein [uncultured marine virus]